jgi:hypothetical protein
VCSLAGVILVGAPGVLGIIFGFVARSQISRSRGGQTGIGLCIAGIVVGFLVVAFWVLAFVLAATHPHCAQNKARC